MVRCCNAALGAPGPIPSGPFPHQNPKSRDADRAGFVRGSLQQDHAAAETTNQQILICGDRKVVSLLLASQYFGDPKPHNHTPTKQDGTCVHDIKKIKVLNFI